VSVSRETVLEVVSGFEVPEPARTADAVLRLLEALAAEPDPPTTVRKPEEALDVHVADSLSGLAVPALRSARRIADIGAGAGFPGLVLAAALPDAHVDLIEAAQRKCVVIDRLALAAGIQARARAVPSRAEDWARGERGSYDAVTARALAPLAVICEYAAPLLLQGGVLVAWKGTRDAAEEAAGAAAARQLGLVAGEILPVTPFEASTNRHLHVYSKVTDTPSKFPRRAGMAIKKPFGSSQDRQ
jgi:16S rRNA (guanine527-N7)-methyltransferase